MKYEVVFFEDNRGRSPVKDFLDELQIHASHDKSAKQLLSKIVFYIEILERTGSRSGLPYTKFIGNGIWELELRPSDHRIFFFFWDGNQIVLLHPFRKTTKKTPQREIRKAEREMLDWIENSQNRSTRE
ncbi:type II toxin-antitoxin system RelE/ParE family toxin [Sporosarcina luteola]|uniref:type II toxin-antitoxin system RelE/ParE family toxin n=1 Tax=Sporosarcina luteola TaxID=582850 RepID=UPI002042414A|nr:type II toxin-antitoxin system RelE/ParE family toxin [Sporosarcina luteola]MCM3712005.1 type II toxin-antitoxin system RelE/ParE family toxin [Sporosarcina luteola]